MHFLARSSQSSLDILSKWVWVHTRAHAANFLYITENSNFLDVICNTYVCLYVVNIADEKIYNLKPSSMPFQFYNWIHFKLSRWCTNSCPSKKYHPLKKKESMHFSDRSSMCTYIYYYAHSSSKFCPKIGLRCVLIQSSNDWLTQPDPTCSYRSCNIIKID